MSSRPTNSPLDWGFILEKGLFLGVAYIAVFVLFFYSGLFCSVFGQALYVVAVAGVFVIMSVWFIKNLKKEKVDFFGFSRVLLYLLLFSMAAGFVASVWDILMEKALHPGWQLESLECTREKIVDFMSESGMSMDEVDDRMEDYDQQVDKLKKNPPSVMTIIFGRLTMAVGIGLVFGIILALILRDKKSDMNEPMDFTEGDSENSGSDSGGSEGGE